MSRYAALLLPFLLAFMAHGQSSTATQRVLKLMDIELHIRIDASDHLVLDHFREGVRRSQDRIPLYVLRMGTMQHSSEQGVIMLACPQDVPRCMSTEHFRMNTIRRVSHIELSGAGNDLTAVMEAIRELAATAGMDLAETRPDH